MALEFQRNLQLSTSEFFNAKNDKTGICVHHTVGWSAESTFNWWCNDKNRVGTSYIIDKDGTLFEVFEPEYWAWQFGLPWKYEEKIAFEKRFIGIELASEGGLLEENGKYYCFDRISPRTEKSQDKIFDSGTNYRGYRYFDRYEPEQVDTLIKLIDQLCDQFDIPRKMKEDSLQYYGKDLIDFEGIIGHVMVREDKTDPAPVPELWEQLKKNCRLEIDVLETETSEEAPAEKMSADEIKELF